MAEEKKEATMSDVKKEFLKHLKQARTQGIAIGTKTMAVAVMAHLDKIDPESIDSYKECFDNIKSICEKTIKLSLAEFSEEMKTIQEIIDVANDETRKVDVFENLSEEDKAVVEKDLNNAQKIKQEESKSFGDNTNGEEG